MTTPSEDQILVNATLAGDSDAFNQLVERYQNRAFGLCYRMLGDSDAAADVAQDAFISAYRHLPSLRGEFRPWLMRIVANACRDVLRSNKRHPNVSLDSSMRDEDDSPVLQIADENPNPEEHLMRAELHRSISVALLQIPADQRTVVILSDIEGMSYEEIAETTGANIGTVKSRLNRARARLREIFVAAELFPTVRRLIPDDDT